MKGTIWGIDSVTIFIVCIAGILFGILYNQLIAYLHRRGLDEGYTWLEVIIGVATTIGIAVPLIGLSNALLLLLIFACTGTPMVAGEISRYVQARKAFQENTDMY